MPVVVPWRASTDTVNAVRCALGVVGDHQREPQLVEPLALDRHADHAARVADHERHRLGRHLLGRHDEVALVLAIGVVDDDHELAPCDGGDGVLDLGERHARLPACRSCVGSSRRSTYFASDVDLEVDGVARPLGPERRDRERVRDHRDARTPSSCERGDGEADAVDGDRALLDDVAQHVARRGERRCGSSRRPAACALDDRADAVDVALHDVATEAVGEAHRPFEVDRVAGARARRASCGRGSR